MARVQHDSGVFVRTILSRLPENDPALRVVVNRDGCLLGDDDILFDRRPIEIMGAHWRTALRVIASRKAAAAVSAVAKTTSEAYSRCSGLRGLSSGLRLGLPCIAALRMSGSGGCHMAHLPNPAELRCRRWRRLDAACNF